jgi:hypothetical protein
MVDFAPSTDDRCPWASNVSRLGLTPEVTAVLPVLSFVFL